LFSKENELMSLKHGTIKDPMQSDVASLEQTMSGQGKGKHVQEIVYITPQHGSIFSVTA
jgi:hypothetical protein